MLCPSCNTVNRDDARFCKTCRYQFSTSTRAPEAVVVNQAPGQTSPVLPEDPSLQPTQILGQEHMRALHSRLWQKDKEQVRHQDSAIQNSTTDIVDMPTAISTGTTSAQQDSADVPTFVTNQDAVGVPPTPPASDDAQQIAPPPPSFDPNAAPLTSDDAPGAAYMHNEYSAATESARKMEPAAEAAQSGSEDNNSISEAAGQEEHITTPEPAAPADDFPVLALATLVIGRYEVTQVVSTEATEHVYQVTDHQGYQHCWNCGSEQNAEGDEFCIDCGAALLDVSYLMREYSATELKEDEANVLRGAIANTFVDQGRTYVIELPLATQNRFPTGVHVLATSDSDAGNVRRSEPNEDSTLVLHLQRVHESQSSPAGIFLVADGLGGHDNGQVASRMTVNIIAERMVRELFGTPLAAEKAGEEVTPPDEDALMTLLQGAVEDANAALCQVNQRDKTDMGSTLTGFLLVGDHAYIVNVGDSRTYMVRGGQLYKLTTDHSLVGQLVQSGLIQPDDVYTHPQRSQIFRSLGDKLNVQIDLFKQEVHPGDILLSCSDGLWEMVRDPQIESILSAAPNPQAACTQLLEAANANGGEDNVSAVVVFVQ